jgi:type II secretory pathway pseudopilin PulG
MEQMLVAMRKDASTARFQRQVLEQSLTRLQSEKADIEAQAAAKQQAARQQTAAASGCKTSLAHLAPRLPVYQVDQIQQVRSAILAEDLNGTLSRARSQGFSTAQAASVSLQSANNADGEVRKGVNCIRSFATNPDQVVGALESGVFRFSSTRMSDLNISESCAAQYVVLKYAAIAMRESAVQMACLAQSR